MLKINNVLIVPMMLMVNNDTGMMYETMFNYYQTSGGEQFLRALKTQDDIKILFFNERHENVRSIRMNNSLKAGIEEMENYLRKSIPWSMKDFDLTKEELYRQYPTGMDLWKAIDKINI